MRKSTFRALTAIAMATALVGCTGPRPPASILAKDGSSQGAVPAVATAEDAAKVTVDVMLPYLSPDATDLTLHLDGDVYDTDVTIPPSKLDHGRYAIDIPIDTFKVTADMPTNPDGSTYEPVDEQTINIADLIDGNDDPSILVESAFVPAAGK